MISHVKQLLPSLLVGLQGKECRHLKLHKCNSLLLYSKGEMAKDRAIVCFMPRNTGSIHVIVTLLKHEIPFNLFIY